MGVNKKTARFAGLFYLAIIVAGIFAEFFVRSSLKVPGDAAATAANIMASTALFRSGITADLIMIICDIALAASLYILLRPVNDGLSLLGAFFRLIQAAILAVNLLNLFYALQLVSGAGYLTAIGAEQLYAQALFFFEAHATGYTLGLLFFAFNCLITGYLVYKASYFPKILGFMLVIAGAGYLTDSFAQFLLPNYAAYADIFALVVFVPAIIGELAMTLWLLIKGINTPAREPSISLSATRAEGVAG